MRIIKCKECKEEKPYYGKKLCKTCYQRLFMKKFRKTNDKTTFSVSRDTINIIKSKSEDKESYEDTLKRLLSI